MAAANFSERGRRYEMGRTGALEARAPRQYCDCSYRNSLQNEVSSITMCITLNAKMGK